MLKTMPVTLASYSLSKAWSKLTSYFDNNRLVINSCWNTLFQLKQLSKESAVDLKTIRDETKEAVEILEVLGRPVHH